MWQSTTRHSPSLILSRGHIQEFVLLRREMKTEGMYSPCILDMIHTDLIHQANAISICSHINSTACSYNGRFARPCVHRYTLSVRIPCIMHCPDRDLCASLESCQRNRASHILQGMFKLLTTPQNSEANYNFYNYAHSILILMLWILPINLPVLVVWIRNIAVHWLTPFSSHHNILSIMPYILLVETLSTGRMIPRVQTR